MDKKVARLMKNLNGRTRETILDILGSPTKWNLIQFYKANPFSIHTPRGLANIIGRGANQVFKDAEDLANAGVLKKISENGNASSIYSYEPYKEIAAAIDALVENGSDPQSLRSELQDLNNN